MRGTSCAASRVAVCIGTYSATRSADATARSSSGCTARSRQVTVAPTWRSQAAGEAKPNGWRPSSYVEIRTTLTLRTTD